MIKLFVEKYSRRKIIRALQIIRVKQLILMTFYEINICEIRIFRLYAAYNKHELIKIGNQTSEKSQVLSQFLE